MIFYSMIPIRDELPTEFPFITVILIAINIIIFLFEILQGQGLIVFRYGGLVPLSLGER